VNLDTLIGRTLGGKYRLEGMIASGGFGAVFRAVQMPLNRQVALKVNLHGQQPAMRARFKREADVLTRLRHPGIVQLLDYGEEVQPDLGPIFYMVQEFVPGEPLKGLLDRQRTLPPHEAVAILDELLVALAEAHRLGIVHRDIKPSNLMLALEPDGRRAIRILDFGISKATESVDALGTLTATGAFLGTPAYMAPEQCQHLPIGPATDIYAVGVLLYRMLAGRLPFRANSLWGYLSQHIEAPVPDLPDDVPQALTSIVRRAMAKSPAERFASAEQMREALLLTLPDASTRLRARRAPSASLPPLPPEATPRPEHHPGTAPYGGAGTAPFAARPSPPTAPSGPLPTLGPAFGESTTGGPMVLERPPERRPRWWVAALAVAVIALASGLTALNVEDSTDAGIPSRIQLSVSAPERPAAGPDTRAAEAADAGIADAGIADDGIADAIAPAPDARPQVTGRPARRARRRARRASTPKAPAATASPSKAPSLDRLLAAFDLEIGRCDCARARARLDAIRRADPPSAAVKARRYEEECQMRLPGNCRSR